MAATYASKGHNRSFQCESDGDSDEDSDEYFDAIHTSYRNWIPERLDEPKVLLEEKLDELKNSCKESCHRCCKRRRIIRVEEIRKGQHISLPGENCPKIRGEKAKLYYHHAIVKDVLSTTNHKITLKIIHFQKKELDIENSGGVKCKTKWKFTILESEITYDLKYDELYVNEYDRPLYSPTDIVQRAESVVKKEESISVEDEIDFANYNLISRNCEHFARWCVVGKDTSFQVQSCKNILEHMFFSLFGETSKIAKIVLRFMATTSDDISGLFRKANVIPISIIGGVSLLSLIICIIKTALLINEYRGKDICWTCLKKDILGIWIKFGTFLGTSVITYLVVQFALPLLAPGFGIPLLIALLFLSLGLIWLIPSLLPKCAFPFKCKKRKINHLSEVQGGDILTLKYYGLDHDVLVTNVYLKDNCSSGAISGVHYSLPSIFNRRCIKEDTFIINLDERSVWVHQCDSLNDYPPTECVARAKARIGEKMWNPLDNTSTHFCHWVKQKSDLSDREKWLSMCDINDITRSDTPSSFLVGNFKVHHIDEIREGDVVQFKNGPTWDKGIAVGLKGEQNGRTFKMDVMVEKGIIATVCKLVTRTINLNNDDLILWIYHPVHCFSMEERRNRALAMKHKRSGRWTQSGFVEECIKKKSF